MVKGTNKVLAAAVLAGFVASGASALVVTSGYDASLGADDMAVRYRSFRPTGGDEVYLGVPDLGVAANRTAQQVNWANAQTWGFSFTYDPVLNLLTSTVDGYSPLTYAFTDDLVIDALHLTVADRDTTGEMWLTGLTVNGQLAGDFGVGVDGYNDWMLTDIAPGSGPAGSGLTVSGTINRTGTFGNSQELTRIDIRAGGKPASVPDAGSSVALLGMALTGIAVLRRKLA